jgi:hypothetical protein
MSIVARRMVLRIHARMQGYLIRAVLFMHSPPIRRRQTPSADGQSVPQPLCLHTQKNLVASVYILLQTEAIDCYIIFAFL